MLEQWVDQHRDGLIGFAAKLVATPSPNPPGNEQAVVAVILAEMERLADEERRKKLNQSFGRKDKVVAPSAPVSPPEAPAVN